MIEESLTKKEEENKTNKVMYLTSSLLPLFENISSIQSADSFGFKMEDNNRFTDRFYCQVRITGREIYDKYRHHDVRSV